MKFLSNIQLKTKEELANENLLGNLPIKHIKKINFTDQPTKIEECVRDLMSYSRECMRKDATEYLLKLSKLNEENSPSKERNYHKKIEQFVEVEESDGLKLIKLDSFKKSYFFHLEIKSNYNFEPLLLNGFEDLSPDVSEVTNLIIFQFIL